MNDLLESVAMFGLAAFCASRLIDGYRIGKMQPIMRAAPTFDRVDDAMFFWAATAFNAALVTVGTVGGIILLIGAWLPQ